MTSLSQSLDLSQHPDTDRFLNLLKKISDIADEDKFRSMKFLLISTITPKNLEKCKDMMDIFTRLMQKALLTPDRMDYLKTLVQDTWSDSKDMSYLFEEYEGKGKSIQRQRATQSIRSSRGPATLVSHYSPTMRSSMRQTMSSTSTAATSYSSHIRHGTERSYQGRTIQPRFQQVFEHTASRLGTDWQVLARLMDIPEYKLDAIDRGGTAYDKAMVVLKEWYISQTKPSVTELRRLLKVIPRNDIADDIKEKFQNKKKAL